MNILYILHSVFRRCLGHGGFCAYNSNLDWHFLRVYRFDYMSSVLDLTFIRWSVRLHRQLYHTFFTTLHHAPSGRFVELLLTHDTSGSLQIIQNCIAKLNAKSMASSELSY